MGPAAPLNCSDCSTPCPGDRGHGALGPGGLRLKFSGFSGGSATTLRGVRADRSPSSRPNFHQREGSSGSDRRNRQLWSIFCIMDRSILRHFLSMPCAAHYGTLHDPCCACTGMLGPPLYLPGFSPPQRRDRRCVGVCIWM